MLADLRDVPMTDVPIRGADRDAPSISPVRLDHSPYDCLYLALAERESCRVVTADWPIFPAAAAGAAVDWPTEFLRLENVP